MLLRRYRKINAHIMVSELVLFYLRFQQVYCKDFKSLDRRLIICTKNSGYWLTVWGNTVTGTVLVAT